MTVWTPKQAYIYAYSKQTLVFPKDAYISEHFTWNEVFINQQHESVPNCSVFFNAKKLADKLEVRRKKSGNCIMVHRWYSSPRYNKLVVYKGADTASMSVHTLGGAVDFHEANTSISDSVKGVRKDCPELRIESGTTNRVHADTGHPYIPNGMTPGFFTP